MQRLNVRLVIALASVALIALLISAATLTQILPGLFVKQAETRASIAAAATALLMEDNASRVPPDVLATPELRNTQFLLRVAQTAADTLAQGTVSIFNPDGSLAATASPTDDTDAKLRSQGLRPDPDVSDQGVTTTLGGFLGLPERIRYTIVVSEPYTSRLATLDSVRGTLIFPGVLALAVSMVVGAVIARRLTTPLARLRRASSRLAQGQLDERAPRSDIAEIDDLARPDHMVTDRLSHS